MELENRNAVLLATVRGPAKNAHWAMVVSEGRDAVVLWERYRHGTVFADFGSLADKMTGVSLARTIRAKCRTTSVFLLSDELRPEQVKWGMSQGATEVIRRTQQAIGERLPGGAPVPPSAEFPSSFPANENPEAIAALVARRLNEAGLGPAATLAVEDAMQSLLQRNGGLPFSALELARAVSKEIPDAAMCGAFMQKFGGQ